MNTMVNMSVAAAALVVVCFVSLAAASSHRAEVCQWQTFEARCHHDEVIVMKQARYGRMRVGKCLPRNYFVGCSADVIDYMHGRCSGRRHCRVPIPDAVMFAAQPCPRDLVAYLEADYECVKVAKWNKESCDQVMTANTGLIAKPADTVQDIRKKHHCPRRIVAQPGQTINVYLSDFFNAHHRHHHHHHQLAHDAPSTTAAPTTAPAGSKCITYGHIAEDGTAAPVAICGGDFKKNQLVYRSKANVIDITLTAPSSHVHHYLIKYEVVGCPALNAPKNGWIEMKSDSAIVHCNNSMTASELVCSGTQWVGQVQNCSADQPQSMSISGMPLSNLFTNTGLLVAVSIGVALGVLVGIALLAFAVTFFSRSNKKGLSQQLPESQQNSRTNLLKRSFNGSQDSGNTASLDGYSSLPVVDPSYMPVIGADGSKTFAPVGQPTFQHVINHLYEDPRVGDVCVNMASFNNVYAPTTVPVVEQNIYGGVCAEHKLVLTDVETNTNLPTFSV